MTTNIFTTTLSHTTDAEFRTLHQAIDTAIQAVGLAPEADTGQINFTTVTRPVAASTSAGFRIYKLGNFFIRLDFCTGSTTSIPGWRWRFGTATDGAGTILGTNQSPLIDHSCGTTASTATHNHRICSDGSTFLVLALNITRASNDNALISIERSRNSSGVANNNYLNVCNVSGTLAAANRASNANAYIISGTSTIAPLTRSIGVYPIETTNSSSTALTSGIATSIVPTHPTYFPDGVGGFFQAPGIATLNYYGADYTTLVNQTISVYGTNRTYLPLGSNMAFQFRSGNTGLNTLMIWE